MKRLSKILLILFLLFLFTLINCYSYSNSLFNDLSSNIFRLHIIANSDTAEDQELKLIVRDNIIEYLRSKEYKSKEELIHILEENIDELQKIAITTIKENGYNYNVTLEIGNFYFPTKYYGNISMPSRNL